MIFSTLLAFLLLCSLALCAKRSRPDAEPDQLALALSNNWNNETKTKNNDTNNQDEEPFERDRIAIDALLSLGEYGQDSGNSSRSDSLASSFSELIDDAYVHSTAGQYVDEPGQESIPEKTFERKQPKKEKQAKRSKRSEKTEREVARKNNLDMTILGRVGDVLRRHGKREPEEPYYASQYLTILLEELSASAKYIDLAVYQHYYTEPVIMTLRKLRDQPPASFFGKKKGNVGKMIEYLWVDVTLTLYPRLSSDYRMHNKGQYLLTQKISDIACMADYIFGITTYPGRQSAPVTDEN